MKQNILLVALLLFSINIFAEPVEEGKTLFTSRCATCHKIDQVFVGPALGGVEQRHSIDWIVKFVQSSQTMIKDGDKAANELFTKFNKIPMPDHTDLTADNIKNIVEYIQSGASADVAKAPVTKTATTQMAFIPLTPKNIGFFFAYLGGIAGLVYSLLLFVRVKKYQRTKTW